MQRARMKQPAQRAAATRGRPRVRPHAEAAACIKPAPAERELRSQTRPPLVEPGEKASGRGRSSAAPPPQRARAPSSIVKQPSRRLSSCAAAPIIAALALPSERAAPEVPGKGELLKAVWKASARVRRASVNCGRNERNRKASRSVSADRRRLCGAALISRSRF